MEKNILELLKIRASVFGVCFCMAAIGFNVFTLISSSVAPQKHLVTREIRHCQLINAGERQTSQKDRLVVLHAISTTQTTLATSLKKSGKIYGNGFHLTVITFKNITHKWCSINLIIHN